MTTSAHRPVDKLKRAMQRHREASAAIQEHSVRLAADVDRARQEVSDAAASMTSDASSVQPSPGQAVRG